MATKPRSIKSTGSVEGDLAAARSLSTGINFSQVNSSKTYSNLAQASASGTRTGSASSSLDNPVGRVAGASTAPIAADALSASAPIQMPQPSADTTGATAMAAGAEAGAKTIGDYIKEITPPETETSKQYNDILGSINNLLPELGNKKAEQAKVEKQLGIPDTRKQLAELNGLMTSRLAEYNKAIAETETAPGETPLGLVLGRQAVIRRNQAADLGLLQARGLALQGQLEAAQETANRAIDLKYGTMEDTINIKMQQLQLIQPILDKEERRYATALERKYTDEREALAEKKAKAKENVALALEAGLTTRFVNKNGEFFRTSDGMSFSTPAEFFAAAGVNSFEEAYSRGLIGDYSPDLAANRSIIADMITKYPDAGITLRDTLESAQSKLGNSRIYGEQVRPPMGSGGGGGAGGVLGLTNQQIDNISPLVSQFQSSPIVQRYNTIGEGYSFARSIADNSKNPSDHQAMIYALAKALDPDSVVREGEYATVQKYSQSMAEAYGKSVNQAIAGTGFLSEDAIRNIKATIATRFQASERSYKNLYSETERRVNLIGNTDKGGMLLNNYGGAFVQNSAPIAGEANFTGPVANQQQSTTPTQNFWQKASNWLFGE